MDQIDKIISEYIRDRDLGKALGEFFLIEFLGEKHLAKLIELFPKVSKEKLRMEWLVFDIFSMTVALASHYKNLDKGPIISQKFNQVIGDKLIKRNLFHDPQDYINFVTPRLSQYWEELNRKDAPPKPNGLYWMAKQFCVNVGGPDDLSQVLTIAEVFAKITPANKKFIESIDKI